MRIAVALDSGEVVGTGHGHFGEAVNRAATLVDQARGGEILVGEATKSLLEGQDLGDLELVELRDRSLTRAGPPIRVHELIVGFGEAVNLDERRGTRGRGG